MNNIFMIEEDELGPLFKASVKKNMPDVNVISLGEGGIGSISIESDSDESISKALVQAGYSGIAFIMVSSCLIISDFRNSLMKPEDMKKFYKGYTYNYMFMGPDSHSKSYDILGINFTVGSSRVRFLNLDLVNQPKELHRLIRMPLKFRFGADPLIDKMMRGTKLLEFSRDSLRAHIIDFGRELLNPKTTIDECHAYPFDVYARYAEEVKDELPPDSYKQIMKNATRTEFTSQFRECLI